MEKSQELALTQMRKSVQKLGSSTENFGEPTLMRFLIARSMDADKAAKMFVKWQEWRSTWVPNGFVPESEIGDELEARKLFLQGLSRSGRPLMVGKASKHFPSKDQLQFKKYVIYLLDKAIASSFKGREIGNEKMIVILDLQNIGYKNVDARGLITGFQFLQCSFLKRLLDLHEKKYDRFLHPEYHSRNEFAYYPERLAKLFFLNMPGFFVSVWRMISRFLEKATLEKIVIVSNEDEREQLFKEIGAEVLPEEYGGQAKLVPIQDVVLPPLDN